MGGGGGGGVVGIARLGLSKFTNFRALFPVVPKTGPCQKLKNRGR